MSSSQKYLQRAFLMASSIGSLYVLSRDNNANRGYLQFLLRKQQVAECWISDEERKRLQSKKINTNVYVWGEGQQVDIRQDYSNYTPKKLKPFRGKDKPNVIDVAFGWYHEAYIDLNGKLYVCKKPKLSSIKVEEIDEKDRPDLVEVKTIPGNPKIKQATFTRQRMFVLTEKGEVYVFKISEYIPEMDMIDHFKKREEIRADLKLEEPVLIKDISNIKMISSGSDHFLALSYDGKVYAMGDDTFGQCGQTSEDRQTTAPFFEKRFGKPQLVQLPEKVVKIVSGYRHNFAITDKGNLYGWGYNNQQQLSHGAEYAQEENPWHAIFTPVLIKNDLEGKFVLDAAAGEEFSVILCKNLSNKGVQEVYSCGNNLRGQLGINRVSHLQDMQLIEDLSGFVDAYSSDGVLNINHVACGRRHSIVTFDYGAFFAWGDNEHGQLGDKKRRFLESPYPKSKFEQKHNVENVICGIDSCAVIVEDLEGKVPAIKKKKKAKKSIKQSEMITSADQLKAMSEQRMSKDPVKDVKLSVVDRLREKWHNLVYSSKKQPETPSQHSEVKSEIKK